MTVCSGAIGVSNSQVRDRQTDRQTTLLCL